MAGIEIVRKADWTRDAIKRVRLKYEVAFF